MFAGLEVVVHQYCFHELISTAQADGDTGLAINSIGPMALAWPGRTLVLGYMYISGCKHL